MTAAAPKLVMPDFELERGLPRSDFAERLILGSLLTGEDFGLVRGTLDYADFFPEAHKRIFDCMGEVFDRGECIGVATVANELVKRNQLESVGGLTYLSELTADLPQVSNIESYIRIVVEKSILRRGALAAEQLKNRFLMADEAPSDLLASAEAMIRDLAARSSNKGNLQSAADIVGAIDFNALGKVPPGVIRTPYAGLNRRIVGMFPGELHVLGARPSAGKSAMAMEIGVASAEAGHPTAIFSLEMRREALLIRAACNRAQVDNGKVRHGRMSDVERHAFMRAFSEISELPLFIDDRAHTFPAMERELRRMRPKAELMVIDHLHLMKTVGRHENRNNELAGITRDCKLFAGEMRLPLLLLAQLSRASEKENRPPEMRDLRDCGSIEADADCVYFLHRKEQMTEDGDNKLPVPVDFLLAKNREGAAWIKVPLLLIGRFYQFLEMSEQDRKAIA